MKPIVLILCTGNSCRSQMAEALLRKFQGSRYEVHSAGTDPKPEIHPLAVEVMREIGIDLEEQKPKSIETYLGKVHISHILIVCDRANQSCPRIWPVRASRDYLPFEDPADATGSQSAKLQVFRRIRDEIAEAMQKWKPSTP